MKNIVTLRILGLVACLAIIGISSANLNAQDEKQLNASQVQEIRVPAGFHAAAKTVPEPYTNTGWAKEIVHDGTGIAMVYIPAGEFMMGSPATEKNRFSDEAQHKVKISKGFYIGKYKVTEDQWMKVTGVNPSCFKFSGKELPVECVSWNDCVGFCRKLGTGIHLPTEAQWEYACRAGSNDAYFFGNERGNLDEYAWFAENSSGSTHPVGLKKPNAWGVYDMTGNVWEWCADLWGAYPDSAVSDPTGSITGRERINRGGSWGRDADACRCAYRRITDANLLDSYTGLRIALEI